MPQSIIDFQPIDFQSDKIDFQPIDFQPDNKPNDDRNVLTRALDWLNSPLGGSSPLLPKGGISEVPSALYDIAKNAITQPSTIPSMMLGFTQGAQAGAHELDTPLNLADAITGFGKSIPLKIANKVVSVGVGAEGIKDIKEGHYGQGLAELAGSILGLKSPLKEPIPTAVPTKEISLTNQPISQITNNERKLLPPKGGTSVNDTRFLAPPRQDIAQENPAFGSLVPDRYKAPITQVREVTREEPILHYKEGGEILSKQTNQKLDSISQADPSIASVAEKVKPVAEKAAKNAPELIPALTDPSFLKKYSAFTKFRKGYLTSSMDQELKDLNPNLARSAKIVQTDAAQRAGTWINEYDKITKNLTDNEFTQFVHKIEDPSIQTSDKVANAVNLYRNLDSRVSSEMKSVGTGLRPKAGMSTIPWEPLENYWPHYYPKEVLEQLKNNPMEIRMNLMKQGKSVDEINHLLSDSQQFGERLISAQKGRDSILPGYRIDKDVYRQHLNEMAHRIEEARNYGPKDLADPDSPVSKMIMQSRNPTRASELMSSLLGREEYNQWRDISRPLVGASAWLHLGLSGISNLASTYPTLIRTDLASFGKGIRDTVLRHQATEELAKESGATLQSILHDLIDSKMGKSSINPAKIYGLEGTENFMRTVSSSAGRHFAESMFNSLKANPAGLRNGVNRARLEDLTLTPIDELLKQPALTEQQLKRASFRTAEMSQGLAGKQNLPKQWNNSALMDVLGLFKRYSYSQGKYMKDMIKQDPLRTIPLFILGAEGVGELTGDAKAGIKGLIRAGMSDDENKILDEISNRGSWLNKKIGQPDDTLIGRLADNAAQSFMLGILADLGQEMLGTGQEALMGFLGPVASDAVKGYDIGINGIKGIGQLIQGQDPTNLKRAGRDLTGFIPVIGPSIRKELMRNQ